MIKKLSIVAMAGLFSVSAAGLGFADEKVIPVPVTPAMPDVRGEVKKEIKDVKSKAKQMKEQATTAVTPTVVAPVPAVTPAMPDVRGEVKKEIKDVKSKAKQMKEEAVKAVTPPIMAPVPATSGEKK
ncbi:histone [Candidatus Methylomirabilis lanthanidiphila]|uniref:Histone n=1 Tax=Candidatus Methylomirabilis lanthanidiphila TaxID=2211376 RepID=A0A564ZL60_9BACT|nr:histone [Candidatus Methylomirabilis lanthanidiphila]